MSMMFFVIDMPRPVPWMPLTVELRSRVNASKIVAANSCVMPMPLSFTRSSKDASSSVDSVSVSVTEIFPPSGVNL